MIGRLRGLVAEVEAEDLLLDVQGVGYLVRCGARTLARLPLVGEAATLQIETQHTQDGGARLYGFLTREDRALFRLLQAVQGVGPKAALAILDTLSPGELAAAVARDDKAAVARANGVGPKLAARIVTELKGKPLGAGVASGTVEPGPALGRVAPIAGDAVSALMGLGIGEAQARRAVDQAILARGAAAPLPEVIRAALQEVGR